MIIVLTVLLVSIVLILLILNYIKCNNENYKNQIKENINDININYFCILFNNKNTNIDIKHALKSIKTMINLDSYIYLFITNNVYNQLKDLNLKYIKYIIIDNNVLDKNFNWVEIVEFIKIIALKKFFNKNLVYIELDMLFKKGTTDYIKSIYSKYNFNMALTYRGKNEWGSSNTGIILYKNINNKLIQFSNKILDEIKKIKNKYGENQGGTNQIALDLLGAECIPLYTTRKVFNIDILSLPIDKINNIYNFNYKNTDAFITHYFGNNKDKMLNQF